MCVCVCVCVLCVCVPTILYGGVHQKYMQLPIVVSINEGVNVVQRLNTLTSCIYNVEEKLYFIK